MFDVYPLFADTRLTAIATSFGSSRDSQTVINLIYIFGVLTVIVGVSILANRLFRLKNDDAAKNKKQALDILNKALLHRSRIDASFFPLDTARLVMSCALEEASSERIALELPAGVEPSANWADKEMICFFRIPGDHGHPFFYKFTARIIGTRKHGDIRYLDFAPPERVELGQKRRHMRLDLPKNDLVDFRIWPELDTQPPCETDLDKWPEPLAIYHPDTNSPVHIMDISGGGVRLEYDPRQFPTLNDFLRRYPTLFMRLELIPMDKNIPCIYYMTARLRTKQEDFGTGAFMLGYEFTECGHTSAEGHINWIKIDPEHGVDDLVTWIFKRHLELYRERELE